MVNVLQVVNHPTYQAVANRGLDGDITVIRLVSPLIFSPVVQQGVIVAPYTSIPDNSPVIHAGWGTTQVPILFYTQKTRLYVYIYIYVYVI